MDKRMAERALHEAYRVTELAEDLFIRMPIPWAEEAFRLAKNFDTERAKYLKPFEEKLSG